MRRLILSTVVLFLVLIAGCGGQPSYSLQPDVSVSESEGSVHVDGKVVLGGKYGDNLEIEGVVVDVRQENTTIERIELGTLNDSRSSVNFSFNTSSPPEKIRVLYREVKPNGYSGTTYYLERAPDEDTYAVRVAQNPDY